MKNPFKQSLSQPSMTKRPSKSSHRPKGQVFFGSKLMGELRILMRLAAPGGNRDIESLDGKPSRSF